MSSNLPYKPSVFIEETTLSDGTAVVRKKYTIDADVHGEPYFKVIRALEREIQLSEQLHHPNLAQLVKHEQDVRVYDLYYSKASGKSIEVLVNERLLQDNDLLIITEQIASALASMHALHPPITHNDIKPTNVHYDPATKQAMLYDFSAANGEIWTDLQWTTHVQGSFGYMAPEVIDGAMPTGKSDVYGLGCLLKYMLIGKNPEGVSDEMLQKSILNKNLIALTQFLTRKDPTERPSAAEVLGYVERIKNGEKLEDFAKPINLTEQRSFDAKIDSLGDLGFYISYIKKNLSEEKAADYLKRLHAGESLDVLVQETGDFVRNSKANKAEKNTLAIINGENTLAIINGCVIGIGNGIANGYSVAYFLRVHGLWSALAAGVIGIAAGAGLGYLCSHFKRPRFLYNYLLREERKKLELTDEKTAEISLSFPAILGSGPYNCPTDPDSGV